MEPNGLLWFIGVFGGSLLNGVAVIVIGGFIKNRHKSRATHGEFDTTNVEHSLAVLHAVADATMLERDTEIKKLKIHIDKLTVQIEKLITELSAEKNEVRKLQIENEKLTAQNETLRIEH